MGTLKSINVDQLGALLEPLRRAEDRLTRLAQTQADLDLVQDMRAALIANGIPVPCQRPREH